MLWVFRDRSRAPLKGTLTSWSSLRCSHPHTPSHGPKHTCRVRHPVPNHASTHKHRRVRKHVRRSRAHTHTTRSLWLPDPLIVSPPFPAVSLFPIPYTPLALPSRVWLLRPCVSRACARASHTQSGQGVCERARLKARESLHFCVKEGRWV